MDYGVCSSQRQVVGHHGEDKGVSVNRIKESKKGFVSDFKTKGLDVLSNVCFSFTGKVDNN